MMNRQLKLGLILTKSFWLAALWLISSNQVHATSLRITYEIPLTNSQHEWHQLVAIPNTRQEFFLLAQDAGIYVFTDSQVGKVPILARSDLNAEKAQFTALATHPSYNLKDQPGYRTIYTAHMEKSINTTKLIGVQTEAVADVVITEWQLSTTRLAVDLATKREVLRIGVPNVDYRVNQIAFKPHAKVWDSDYGQMYIALAGNNTESSSLYRGGILRIDPKKFGLRQYTVPTDNPFSTNDNIPNELYVLGAGNISELVWPERSNDDLLIRHTTEGANQLALISIGQDLRENEPRAVISKFSGAASTQSIRAYHSAALAHLRGATLNLQMGENGWQISSLKMPRQKQTARPAITEWQYEPTRADDNGPLALLIDGKGALMVYNHASQSLFAMSLASESLNGDSQIAATNDTANESNPGNSSSPLALLVIVLIGVPIAWLAWCSYQRHHSARVLISKQFSHFEVDDTSLDITLFRKNEKAPVRVVSLTNILQLKILLNNEEVTSIDQHHLFSNKGDELLREHLGIEKRVKMQPGRIRQITLLITLQNEDPMQVCAYMRKGDRRITRGKFSTAYEKVITLCWQFSQSLSEEKTEPRKFTPILEPEKKPSDSIYRPTLINTQHPVPDKPEHQGDTYTKQSPVADIDAIDSLTPVAPVEIQSTDKQGSIDTKLITALEKLANLKSQGVLTEEEFEQAKQRVLKGLISS